MSFQDAIRKSVLEGFSANDIPVSQMISILAVTFVIGLYIYLIYKLINRKSIYSKNYHISMAMISVITAGIIIAMQSSIVISLGMVGALSIVRFRTAIKDTMDLLFLFWSIGEGIICGAGLFELAIVVALMVTIGLLLLQFIPTNRKPYVLIVNSSDPEGEDDIINSVSNYSKGYKVKSRNLKKNGLDMIIEVRTTQEKELLKSLNKIESVDNTSLLTQQGEIRI
jgi:uncharacterized membrane protein YhiD involved in acid resistance